MKITKIAAVILSLALVIGMFGYTYNFLIGDTFIGKAYEIYLVAFKTVRNGLFNGVPFIVMGYALTTKEIKPSKKALITNGALATVSLCLMVAECFVLKIKGNVSGMDINLFVVPFTYFFMMVALNHVHLELLKIRLKDLLKSCLTVH